MTANLPTDVAADSVATGLTESSLTFSHERRLADQSGFVNRSLAGVSNCHAAVEQSCDDSDPSCGLFSRDDTVDTSESHNGKTDTVEGVTGGFGDSCKKVHNRDYLTTMVES
jgi:hypothetical protein